MIKNAVIARSPYGADVAICRDFRGSSRRSAPCDDSFFQNIPPLYFFWTITGATNSAIAQKMISRPTRIPTMVEKAGSLL